MVNGQSRHSHEVTLIPIPVHVYMYDIEMSDSQIAVCGKCGAEIDPTRRVDFTLKDGIRVCDACFVKETPRSTRSKNAWAD